MLRLFVMSYLITTAYCGNVQRNVSYIGDKGIGIPTTTQQMKDRINLNTTKVVEQANNEVNWERILNSVRVAIAVIYVTVCFIGITGNGVILYIMISVVKTHSVTDIYLLNLAISDFLFVATLPIAATDMLHGNKWIFGDIGCKIFICVNHFVLCAGVFIVSAMSVDRFQSVIFAVRMRTVRTKRRAQIIIGCLWGFSLIYIVPYMLFANVTSQGHCSLTYRNVGNLTAETLLAGHTLFRFSVSFLIPFVVMVVCNSTIVHFLRKRRSAKQKERKVLEVPWHEPSPMLMIYSFSSPEESRYRKQLGSIVEQKRVQLKNDGNGKNGTFKHVKPSHHDEDRVTRLILLVTTVFLICWLPHLISHCLFVLGPNVLAVIGNGNGPTRLIFQWITAALLFGNSALNPFLYAFAGSEFRTRITAMLQTENARKSSRRSNMTSHIQTKQGGRLQHKYGVLKGIKHELHTDNCNTEISLLGDKSVVPHPHETVVKHDETPLNGDFNHNL